MRIWVLILCSVALAACLSKPDQNQLTGENRKIDHSPVQDTSNVTYEIDYHDNGENKVKRSIDKKSGEIVYEEKFFDNGAVEMAGAMKDGHRIGVWKAFFPSGELQSIRNYNELGQEEGMCEVYKKEGSQYYLYYSGYFSKGEKRGAWNFYNQSGSIVSTKNY